MNGKPVLISGGGIGGLTTALALGQRGHAVRVLEQAPQFGAIGYGIQLGPNVLSVFDGLGLSQAVTAVAHHPPAILMLDARDGSEIVRISTGDQFRSRFGHPYLVIHRIDLHDILLSACRAMLSIELISETRVSGVEEKDDGVVALTADGRSVHGSGLVAADGLNSDVRGMLHPNDRPRPSGYVAHRAIVPTDKVPREIFHREVILWGGPGFHIVCYPLRQERIYNIVAVFRSATHAERRDHAAHKAELEETYKTAHPIMQTLLGLMDVERRWPISDRDPIRHWGRGRVTLLGDAAHATLQSLAQGAGMAIEDGVCLAKTLDEQPGDIQTAFRRYEALRRTRTARVQLESRSLWTMYHCDGIEADVRFDTFAGRSQAAYLDCLTWLYGSQDRAGRAVQA
jgi:2-polyprenyl-6-methoxyphenol hydroxylase-like FAD-dependent oxidoreductase